EKETLKSDGRPPPETQLYMGQVGGILRSGCSPSRSRPTRPCRGASQITSIASIPSTLLRASVAYSAL
ncbi:hypothetical protein FIBSPDRAFT_871473, partial [Athelia psychrophila]